jgi:hypothetical protein
MGDGEQREWPNRGLEIFVVGIVLCVLSTSVLAWRIVYGIRTKRKFLLSDFLLIIAAVSQPISSTPLQKLVLIDVSLVVGHNVCFYSLADSEIRSGTPHRRSYHLQAQRSFGLQLLSLDHSNHQSRRNGYPEVCYLCLPTGPSIL